MKLIIGANIEDNRVRLDYKPGPNKPENAPSYTIKEDKADEFVKKYNRQVETLHKITTASVAVGAVGGWILALRNIAKNKLQLITSTLGIPAGIALGFLASAILSSCLKNNLMDKYDVKKYQNQD